MKSIRSHIFASSLLAIVLFPLLYAQTKRGPDEITEIRKAFQHPPDDARIMMRWWWFGPAVTRPELERELRVMKAAGIGGVEIQPVYPLALDDASEGFHNEPYLSDEFLADLGFTSKLAKELGMRLDVTLGSGWPYGGPHTPVTEAASRLRIERVPVIPGAASVAAPALENGEQIIAVFLAKGNAKNASGEGAQLLGMPQAGREIITSVSNGPHAVVFFIAGRTGQQVKRPGVGAEGFVLDHYNREAVDHHLSAVGDRLMKPLSQNPPHSVFSDSLEVIGSDWTPDLPQEFKKRRGYDLVPKLSALIDNTEPDAAAIRHDWGQTLTELAEERYLTPIRNWAHAHGTLFRSQTYGEPPVILSTNDLVDLPEGEHGPEWRAFSAARWASSASHIYGRPVTSTETWTWLHSPAFRATPLDMKAEADLHFVEGINQLIGHGWPYSPNFAGEPGWRFYAAAAFNEHNPWFQVMPEITAYLQRLSYILRQGKPANDIAIYLPTDDAWAHFRPGKTSVDQSIDDLLGLALIPQILNTGYNFDFVDDAAILKAGIPYPVLVVPGAERMPIATLEKIQRYLHGGGKVIATRRLPSVAPGWQARESETPQVKKFAHQIFETNQQNAAFVPDETKLSDSLKRLLTPDFAGGEDPSKLAFVHRKLTSGEIYFFVNTSNQNQRINPEVRVNGKGAEWWDPMSGRSMPVKCEASGEVTKLASLTLAPYESRLLILGPGLEAREKMTPRLAGHTEIDLSGGWRVRFSGLNHEITMQQLHSWADDEQTRFYSGEAVYEKTFRLEDEQWKPGAEVTLDFGSGEAVPEVSGKSPGMRALLESPVRESAIVYVNDVKVGSVWHPPYQLSLTKYVHGGENQLRLVVANTAINEIAGHALPSYKLLNSRYGERFQPQGFENLKPLPSGILGRPQIIIF